MKEENDIFSFISAKKTDLPDDSYFEALSNKVIEKQTIKVIPLYRKSIFKWAVAATIILPLAIYFITQGAQDETRNESVLLGLNDIPQAEIHSYIMENMEEFNFSEVIEMVPAETVSSFEIERVTLETKTESSFFDGISQEEIENYFNSNDIDPEELELEEVFI